MMYLRLLGVLLFSMVVLSGCKETAPAGPKAGQDPSGTTKPDDPNGGAKPSDPSTTVPGEQATQVDPEPTGEMGKLNLNVKFGKVDVPKGDEALAQIILKNLNTKPVSDLRLELPATYDFQIAPANSTCPKVLAFNESCVFEVTTTANVNKAYDDVIPLKFKLDGVEQTPLNAMFKGEINVLATTLVDKKKELTDLLTARSLDQNLLTTSPRSVTDKGRTFEVDDKTGDFYEKTAGGNVKRELVWNDKDKHNSYYEIRDPNKPTDKPFVIANKIKQGLLNGMALLQRQIGIFTLKSKNPECYIAYAAARFKTKDPSERLLALERDMNPRPLNFRSDADWDEFKKDIKELFKEFNTDDAYIAIVGSGTTFVSENPTKGKNSALFEEAPLCETNAKDKVATVLLRTYNTPGADRSDLDINILIPELSDLCEKAFKNKAHKGGNTGAKEVYFENTFNQCLERSPKKNIRSLVKPGKLDLQGAAYTGSKKTDPNYDTDDKYRYQRFFKKWNQKLNNADINFSVRIRPDQAAHPKTKPGEKDFKNDAVLKKGFIIPVKN